MKRILHYLKVRRRALKLRRNAGNTTVSIVKNKVRGKEIYTDDGDLGYC